MAIVSTHEYYTFEDILIKPSLSHIETREGISLSQSFLGLKLDLPIISANMDYVTGWKMASAMSRAGGLGILHRFMKEADIISSLEQMEIHKAPIAFSVGVRDNKALLKEIHDTFYQVPYICVDVAHGHHKQVEATIKFIKNEYNAIVIAGNVATWQGYVFLVNAGADAIKVGIGPGSVCTTRTVTGVGVPQLSAIMEIAEYRRYHKIPIIADGGIKSSGDIVKALAAGADTVMLGHLLAGSSECPGEPLESPSGRRYRPYRGQSIFGVNGLKYTPEGISGYVPEKGPVADTLKQLAGGIRSGMSYVGAQNLEELRENTEFIKVSKSTHLENSTRVEELV